MSELLVDQSGWGAIRVTGSDRVRFVQGMCSANVATLAEGESRPAVMLDVKGRVTGIFDVANRGEHLLLLCSQGTAEGTLALLDRHAIMDDVTFETVVVDVYRRWPDRQSVWTAKPEFGALASPECAAFASPDAVEIRRVEAGMPRFGVDVSPADFPFESLLAQWLDYEKGCYIGQEPVYRVHAKGKPSRTMRGLRFDGAGPVAVGAVVEQAARANSGTITSAVVSPDLGSIALAYLHRSACNPGDPVTVDGRSGVISALPF